MPQKDVTSDESFLRPRHKEVGQETAKVVLKLSPSKASKHLEGHDDVKDEPSVSNTSSDRSSRESGVKEESLDKSEQLHSNCNDTVGGDQLFKIDKLEQPVTEIQDSIERPNESVMANKRPSRTVKSCHKFDPSSDLA